MILCDYDIIKLGQAGMIDPFVPYQVRVTSSEFIVNTETTSMIAVEPNYKVISYGVSSYGYDIRVSNEFKVFKNSLSRIVDPKNLDTGCFDDVEVNAEAPNNYIIIPPNSFALARTVEHFNIPRDVTVLCVGKSTYARVGIIVNTTPFEAGWRGHATMEISNSTPLPVKVYANEGIAQAIFFRGNPCLTSYADRKGKYQDQTGITLPRM